MDNSEIVIKIATVMEAFGMSGVVAAKAMGIAYSTFRSKKNENNLRHQFNKKNLDDLIFYIKKETEKL